MNTRSHTGAVLALGAFLGWLFVLLLIALPARLDTPSLPLPGGDRSANHILTEGMMAHSLRQADSGDQPNLVTQLRHAELIDSVAITPNGALVLTGSRDATIRLWHAER